MTVLIVKANIGFFQKEFGIKEFKSASENTCTFQVTDGRFKKMINLIRAKGLNPYAIMSW